MPGSCNPYCAYLVRVQLDGEPAPQGSLGHKHCAAEGEEQHGKPDDEEEQEEKNAAETVLDDGGALGGTSCHVPLSHDTVFYL